MYGIGKNLQINIAWEIIFFILILFYFIDLLLYLLSFFNAYNLINIPDFEKYRQPPDFLAIPGTSRIYTRVPGTSRLVPPFHPHPKSWFSCSTWLLGKGGNEGVATKFYCSSCRPPIALLFFSYEYYVLYLTIDLIFTSNWRFLHHESRSWVNFIKKSLKIKRRQVVQHNQLDESF